MSPTAVAHLQMHFCVLLWGFTAVLGKLISLPAPALVWWRMLIVTVLLALLPRTWRGLMRLTPRQRWTYAGIGVVVAVHWLSFYAAVKLSNASVTATCIALTPVFLALIDPLLGGRRFALRELLLGLAVVPGVALVVGGTPTQMNLGLAVGVGSAALAALFGALNKRHVHGADPLLLTAVELGAGTLFITLLLPVLGGMPALPDARDTGLLLMLAVGCTLLPFTLSLVALRSLSAFAAVVALNLEPVYAILIGSVLLAEHTQLGGSFYLGVLLIIAVMLLPLTRRRTAGSGC